MGKEGRRKRKEQNGEIMYYKSYRIIGGKPKLVVTDDNDNIVNSLNDEQIKLAIYDNRKTVMTRKRKCCKCGSDKTYISSKGKHIWRLHHKCDKENVRPKADFPRNAYDKCRHRRILLFRQKK